MTKQKKTVKNALIQIRVTQAERALIMTKAKAQGLTMSAYVLNRILKG